MGLQVYFEKHAGTGVLSTASKDGHVNAAVYARPHCFEDGTVGFIMPDRLTLQNLKTNSRAVYLFCQDAPEDGRRFFGKRLYLRKVREDGDQERITGLRRRTYDSANGDRRLVVFEVEKELPLIGPGDAE